MNRKHLAHAALALGIAIGPLVGGGVGHAASPDVDAIRIRTNAATMISTLTWNHINVNGQHRDDGQHHMTSLTLSHAACADVSIDWFDGEYPNPRLADAHMEYNICNSLSGDQTYAFDMSRFNVPPAERAVICVESHPELDGLGAQEICVVALAFTDSATTGI